MTLNTSCYRSSCEWGPLAAVVAVSICALAASGCDESTPGSSSNLAIRSQTVGGSSDVTSNQPNGEEQQAPAASPGQSADKSEKDNSRIVDKTFDDITFDIQPGDPFDRELLTEDILDMVGQRIRIRGYIYPTPIREGLTNFVLVRDDEECCFGDGAALFDCIIVEMVEGNTAKFSTYPVAVEGTFTINELLDPISGNHLAIFRLDATNVR